MIDFMEDECSELNLLHSDTLFNDISVKMNDEIDYIIDLDEYNKYLRVTSPITLNFNRDL